MMEAHVPRNVSGYLQDYNGITTQNSHPHDFRQNYDKGYIMHAGLCTWVNKLTADQPLSKQRVTRFIKPVVPVNYILRVVSSSIWHKHPVFSHVAKIQPSNHVTQFFPKLFAWRNP
jgi:hypothetical protein